VKHKKEILTKEEVINFMRRNIFEILDKSGNKLLCPVCHEGNFHRVEQKIGTLYNPKPEPIKFPDHAFFFKCEDCKFVGDVFSVVNVKYDIHETSKIFEKTCEIFGIKCMQANHPDFYEPGYYISKRSKLCTKVK
jgi:hypothetical protein